MLNIILPMAGSSEEFRKAGYAYPKPLIDVDGKPIIEYVLQQLLKLESPKRFIFILLEEECRKYHLDSTLKLLVENPVIVVLKNPTKGALCSVMMAIDHIGKEEEVLILNSDQIIDIDLNLPLNQFRSKHADTGVITFDSVHPRWSYALIEVDQVVQTAEKKPISRNSIAGFYYFKTASDFFEAAFRTIINQDQLDGIYFISPVVNQYVLANKSNLYFPIPREKYHSFYAPQKVKEFEQYLLSTTNNL